MIHENTIFRAVRGACENAATAHPNWIMDPRLPRSVAKRATGTLVALQRQSLATLIASSDSAVWTLNRTPRAAPVLGAADGATCGAHITPAREVTAARRAWRPFIRLADELIAHAEKVGDKQVAQGMRDVMQMFNAHLQRMAVGKVDP